jgi:hypothetical protein
MCSQSIELACIRTAAAACATAERIARGGCRKSWHWRGSARRANAFAVPAGIQDESGPRYHELHTGPTAIHQQREQLSRYDLDQTEAAHRTPESRQ